VVVLSPVEAGNTGGGRSFAGPFGLTPAPAWVLLPLVFASTAFALAAIGELVARSFARFRPLVAYRLDVAGSLAGIVAFATLSFAGAGPGVWAAVAAVTLAYLQRDGIGRWGAAALAGFVALATGQAFAGGDRWSPYNRIGVEVRSSGAEITANGFPHQSVMPVHRLRELAPFYLAPYERARSLDRVLIVGSGAGNDVAAALDAGAGHVDAVEIDPVLVELGRELHPDDPYGSARVDVHVDDGRAFLERTDVRYDLVVFALPQSVALVGGQSSVRLESFLLTREAIASVRDHLQADGTFALIKGRLRGVYDAFASTTASVFGTSPCVDVRAGQHGERAVLTVAREGTLACGAVAAVSADAEDVPTDDRPFPYVRGATLPPLYLVSMALVVLASVLAVRASAGPIRAVAPHLDLLLMGGAFLMLETTNVVRFALLFGTTWLVNALVFFGILASVLAAIEVAERVRLPRALLYGALFVAMAVAWVVPTEALLGLPLPARFMAGVAVAFTPVFIANVVFAERFASVGASTDAFGANLLGAMLGGVLEYASLMVGYRALVVLVAILYVFAFAIAAASRRRALRVAVGRGARVQPR
jgi:hypothetical protein